MSSCFQKKFQNYSDHYYPADYHSDSDLAGKHSQSTVSQTGSMIFLNGVPVSWRSKKQCRTSKSIAQAEIYALSHTLSDARGLFWKLQAMDISLHKPLTVYTDNDQARIFSKSTCVRSRLQGIFGLHEAWVEELRDDGWLDAQYVCAANNAANILTKSVASDQFRREKRLISNRWRLARG